MILHRRYGPAVGYERTGPLGRLARLVLVAIFAVSLYSIVDGRGSAHFRNPHILTEPGAWVLHVTMLVVFVVLVATLASTLHDTQLARRAQIAAFAALLGSGVAAGVIGQLAFGSVWGFPLADFVWWFDVLMLVVGIASTTLAVFLGTPGCEIGAVRELIACLAGRQSASAGASPCFVGLHVLDDWERRRSQRHSGAGR